MATVAVSAAKRRWRRGGVERCAKGRGRAAAGKGIYNRGRSERWRQNPRLNCDGL
jgi:hypothetical protein